MGAFCAPVALRPRRPAVAAYSQAGQGSERCPLAPSAGPSLFATATRVWEALSQGKVARPQSDP
eukprot:9290780-Lingulodinium_polyedra.AAC.1